MLTVANWPVTALPVRIVNVLPTAGMKLSSRPIFSVPLRPAPPVTSS